MNQLQSSLTKTLRAIGRVGAIGCALMCSATVDLACSSDEADVKGNTTRVIGDSVTLNLTEGSNLFAAAVELIDSEGRRYGKEQLSINRPNGRQLLLTIPAGVATGAARLKVAQEGSDSIYQVPLNIDRLAGFTTDQGQLHLIPFAPAQVSSQSLEVGKPALLSLSDDATTLALASGDQLHLLRISTDINKTRLPVAKASGQIIALAALPSSVVVATATGLSLWEVQGDAVKELPEQWPLKQTKALAVLDRYQQPPIVAALVDCEGGGDCVTLIDFYQQPSASIETLQLDATSSAHSIALSTNGQFVTVADSEAIYGINYADAASDRSAKLSWGIDTPADPTSIVLTRTQVKDIQDEQDIFAVADRQTGKVFVYGAPNGRLVALQQQPESLGRRLLEIAFGRNRQIFALTADRQLLALTVTSSKVDAVNLTVPAGAVDFVVQR